MLETDSPYLTPTPNRGGRNESKYILDIAQKVSKIYNIDIEKIAKITTENANKLFNI
jgi:TatD DNase family protein